MESENPKVADQIVFDYRQAELSSADRALCDYGVKLTLAPGEMGEADVRLLESEGFSQPEIHVAVQVIGYFNYINRIADGLGVEPESWMEIDIERWKRDKGRFARGA